jgi:valyl-tRNA synthetase
MAVIGEMKLLIPLPEQLQQQELQRLEKEQRRLVEAVERLRTGLSNSSFVDKAPAELVEKSRDKLRQLEREKRQISEKIASHQ